jgi:uncharacterized protein (TIGR02246 family)
MSDDEQAIGELVDTWMAASKAGDVEAILELMTDDVLFLTASRKPFGKDEFRASFNSMKGAKLEGQSRIQEIEVAGNWAWIRNHIELAITPEGGSTLHRSGATLTVLRKGPDGRWRLFRDANLVS